MAGYIPDDIVERIKNESDIVSIISGYVSLKKMGKDYKGLCPFHQEKTPSFFVVPAKGFYHCFGCGKSGNVVNFIMEHERLDYPDALRFLAEKSGITIPETREHKSDLDEIYEALSFAGSYFVKSLSETSGGRLATEYLKSRGISPATSLAFGIGYAPQGWDGLINAAGAQKIQPSVLERAGLAIKKEGYYDRFRHRLMIPIKSISGRVIGFGGRALSDQDNPKYLNSPETEVYKKGQMLFGFDVAKDHIRESNEAIVVEGYFDLIALHQSGIKNVVAVSGTGFTPNQAALLARFCEKIILLYDSDSAGIKAAFRACGVLYNSSGDPRIVTLPKGHDPDTFVRENGRDNLKKYIAGAVDIVDFVCNTINGKFSEQSLSMQKRIANALIETISPISDVLTRELLLKKIYSRLDIDLDTLNGIKDSRPISDEKSPKEISSGRKRPEIEFLSLLLSHPELIAQCAGTVDRSLFIDEDNAQIFNVIWTLHEEGLNINIPDLFDRVGQNGLRQRLSEIALIDFEANDADSMIEMHLKKFRQISIKKRINELKKLIGDPKEQEDLLKIENLTREFQNLKLEVDTNESRG